jgi:hypothetical protein
MRRSHALVAFCAGLLATAVAGCSGPGGAATPSPSPLPIADLQRLYVQAADTYDTAEVPIEQQEYRQCPGGAGPANLAQCESALSRDRQVTLAFDDALRGLVFPASAASVVDKLLQDDASLEALQEQAATAPSLTAISTLTPHIFALYAQTTTDAAAVRTALGLPLSSAGPSATPVD